MLRRIIVLGVLVIFSGAMYSQSDSGKVCKTLKSQLDQETSSHQDPKIQARKQALKKLYNKFCQKDQKSLEAVKKTFNDSLEQNFCFLDKQIENPKEYDTQCRASRTSEKFAFCKITVGLWCSLYHSTLSQCVGNKVLPVNCCSDTYGQNGASYCQSTSAN